MKEDLLTKVSVGSPARPSHNCSAELRSAVSQGSTLQGLQGSIGRRVLSSFQQPWHPQSETPRYSRVKLCATLTGLQSRLKGFTLIEIMVVVAVIGILAAAIIPQFMTTKHDARVSAAKGHIAELEAALERFNVHMDRYPTSDEGLKVLVEAPAGDDKKWRGPYIKQLRPDPWGNAYQYRYPGQHHASGFDLWSRGSDGSDGGEGEAADIGNWQ